MFFLLKRQNRECSVLLSVCHKRIKDLYTYINSNIWVWGVDLQPWDYNDFNGEQGDQTQNHLVHWLVLLNHADTECVSQKWLSVPRYAIISNTVHITETCAAPAATAAHEAEKVQWETWDYKESYFGLCAVLNVGWRHCVLWFVNEAMKHLN